ncbi:MAG: phage tail protein [Lachnospiraceae bacterium]|nr:phage tail protein [Lachnospiraceae bacterium]
MIPILFDKTETTFTSNGIGRLSDAISCIVTEERNGQYELKMVYPITGVHYAELAHSRIIFGQPAEDEDNQAFRIYKITKPANGRVTVLAQHISYQLTSIPVSPFDADSAADAVDGLTDNAATACPFTIDTDIVSSTPFKLETPESIRSAIGGMEGSLLDLYGGELEWDMYEVHLHSARGQNRGKIINYGKNITDIKQEESIDKVITGIYPFYSGDEYVELTEKVLTVQTTEVYPYQRIQSLDMTKYFGDVPSESELRERAQEYLTKNTLGVPRLTIKAAFIDDENHVPVNLCDTVTIYYAPLGVSIQAEVVKLEYNVLLERYETMTVGSVQDSILDAVITTDKKSDSNGKAIEREKVQTDAKIRETNDKIDEITYDYVEPQVKSTSSISAGGEAIVMACYFKIEKATRVRFGSTITFETARDGQDMVHLHVIYNVDGTEINPNDPLIEYYDDGRHILTLDFLTSQLSAGSHSFGVAFGVTGGTLS